MPVLPWLWVTRNIELLLRDCYIRFQAANCIEKRTAAKILVQVTHDLRFENETRSGTKAEGLWMHPEYISRKNTDDRNLSFDIGLIRFQKTANRGFSSHYLPTFHNNLFTSQTSYSRFRCPLNIICIWTTEITLLQDMEVMMRRCLQSFSVGSKWLSYLL